MQPLEELALNRKYLHIFFPSLISELLKLQGLVFERSNVKVSTTKISVSCKLLKPDSKHVKDLAIPPNMISPPPYIVVGNKVPPRFVNDPNEHDLSDEFTPFDTSASASSEPVNTNLEFLASPVRVTPSSAARVPKRVAKHVDDAYSSFNSAL
ncbi:hypothetical protein Sjap_025686 [Stephania japonica]|uniref:Uncharacterized protein n=1 Tax=Stephania japonica TaxID=461633 RepID=A0AAP0HJS7_9MAGN